VIGPPRAAVVVVGSEILLDARQDTNGPFIEQALGGEGYACILRLIVGDHIGEIAAAIRTALSRAEIVIVSGGLGPTFDDLTREACADALGVRLERRADIEGVLRERLRRRGLTPPETVYRMADVLQGAEVLTNTVGSAPGQFVAGPPALALLPGVPAELKAMLPAEVLPRLRVRFACAPPLRTVLKIAGLYESEVEARVAPLMGAWTGLESTILAAPGEVTLILRAAANDAAALERARGDVRQALGEAIYAEADEGIEIAVGRLLLARGLTLATAESCTAGMLGAMITSVPGSSAYYLGGAVAYSNRIKEGWLDVPPDLIAARGAVSEEAAASMARGVRRFSGSNLALAVTGVAGPGGGTLEKPVGRVHVAFAAPWGEAARTLNLPGDREMIRMRSCRAALDLLRREISRARGGAPA